jgi:hypothetical protein
MPFDQLPESVVIPGEAGRNQAALVEATERRSRLP